MNTAQTVEDVLKTDANPLISPLVSSKLQLVRNTDWKTVEVNGEDVEIPQDWGVKKIGSLTTCLDNIRKPLSQKERFHKKGAVPYWGANSVVDFVDKELFNGKCILLGEDAAPFFDKSKKVAFISNGPIWPNNHIHILQTAQDYEFLYFKLNDFDYSKILNSKDRPKLTQGLMNSMEIFMPESIDEQTLIAQTLTAQEDHIASLKQQSSLQRKRLDWLTDELLSGRIRVEEDVNGQPTVLKRDEQGNVVDSLPAVKLVANTDWKTVEVNGEEVEIPQEWNVRKIGECASLVNGYAFKSSSYKKGEKFKVLTIRNVQQGYLNDEYYETIKEQPKDIRKNQILNIEDIVLSMTGNVGRVCMINNSNWLLNQRVLKIIPLEPITKKFLFCTLKRNIFCESMQDLANGGAQKNISSENVRSYMFFLPPKTEQTLIAQTLTAQEEYIASLDQMIAIEEKRLTWLTDELLSGRILIQEVK